MQEIEELQNKKRNLQKNIVKNKEILNDLEVQISFFRESKEKIKKVMIFFALLYIYFIFIKEI